MTSLTTFSLVPFTLVFIFCYLGYDVHSLQIEGLWSSKNNGANFNFNPNPKPTVSVIQGKIQGKVGYSRMGKPFVMFLGIPYAKSPPELFRPAVDPESWSKTRVDRDNLSKDANSNSNSNPNPNSPSSQSRDAESEFVRDGTFYRDSCLQSNYWGNGTVGSLDCLYLNVFVKAPESPSDSQKLLPVLVFIGGENFQRSRPPEFYGVEKLMDEEIILVTLNYRLGVFGFLSLTSSERGAKHLPKNLGLKDQVMALKWIQANIHVFGGDRMRVTLFGSGSGAVSVSLHLMSPMSTGLFSNAISQGGSALCPNAIVLDPDAFARDLGAAVGCSANSSIAIFEKCLISKNTSDIIRFQNNATGWEKGKISSPLGPTVELVDDVDPDSEDSDEDDLDENSNIFLPDYPENILREGRLPKSYPWIVGVNSKSGQSSPVSIVRKKPEILQKLNDDWLKFAPLLFGYSQTAYLTAHPGISKKVRDFYFQDDQELIDENNVGQLFEAASHQLFYQCIKRSALLYGKSAPVFLYYFAYEKISFSSTPSDPALIFGVNTELQYFFNLTDKSKPGSSPRSTVATPEIMRRSPSFKFSRSLIKLWTSFARNGTPVDTFPRQSSWAPLSKSEVDGVSPLKWYHLDFESRSMSEPFFPQVNFWHSLKTTAKLSNIMAQYSTILRQRTRARNLRLAKRSRKSSATNLNILPTRFDLQLTIGFLYLYFFTTF